MTRASFPGVDTRTPEQMREDCRRADLTPEERRAALRDLARAREVHTRRLAQIDAIEAGHLAALEAQKEVNP